MSIMSFELPSIPAPHQHFIPYLGKYPEKPMTDILLPYRSFESKLREGFAQCPEHDILHNPYINALPVFDGHEDLLRIRARSLNNDKENEKYIMPLDVDERKPTGSRAVVESMKDFKQNFNLFSESSLVDLDWNNVVAAGSSVVTSLIPVPDKYNTSKRVLREYYHQKLAPSSDVDLFIWGLDEAAAKEKIKQIETRIRNSILQETTTIRTKNAITIASQYPTRHVQIVLRLYRSISEILTGFDVDCSCFAYDGHQVYGTPRAIAAFVTQMNTVDLTRRSPSYENRLSKYAHRGFEVHWPQLDRQKVDPTIFERSFARTLGLARLLVLEKLPKPDERESYLAQRRAERGRPELNTYYRTRHHLSGNVKDQEPDDVAEWVYDDEIANYHSFTVPYGPKYHAKKIEKLLYTKDLLLNAEWNMKDRKVSLHRHPCFIGDAESIMHDCCGGCPHPTTDDEKEVEAEESKIYISGDLYFMKDDPGRQAIGSFNPLTSDDWTDMAYIGNTTELCLKISEGDLAYVEEWCKREDSVIDRRDHTGRTPLQLATQCSTAEIVRCLIDHGARIVARLVDGMTALHIAAARGNSDMVQVLLDKSEANEAEEAEKNDKRKAASKAGKLNNRDNQMKEAKGEDEDKNMDDKHDEDDEDEDMEDAVENDSTTMTEGSFIKVQSQGDSQGETIPEDAHDPDVYDVNVLAWDSPISPLHIAILRGHIEVIKLLVSHFGADVLLPVKILDDYTKAPKRAILTLVLAAQLPSADAANVSRTLFDLGASSAQADMDQMTALQSTIMMGKAETLKTFFEADGPAANVALKHVSVDGNTWSMNVNSPLTSAIKTGDQQLVAQLLNLGANPVIDFEDFLPSYIFFKEKGNSYERFSSQSDQIEHDFKKNTQQPILCAAENNMPDAVQQMLDLRVDINTIDKDGHKIIKEEHFQNWMAGRSLLDIVNERIEDLEKSLKASGHFPEPIELESDDYYLGDINSESYQYWHISKDLDIAKDIISEWRKTREEKLQEYWNEPGQKDKAEALKSLKAEYEVLQERCVREGAKTFYELYPDIEAPPKQKSHTSNRKSDAVAPKVTFQLPGITEKKQVGYLQLFQAVWEGNITSVKALTLAPWGPTGDNHPLQIAVQDSKGFSPFAIAVYRQHPELAKVIIDIAHAQLQPSEDRKPRQRFVINQDSNSDDDSDDGDLAISSDLVDERFTIDNIADLSQAVGSKVKASQMLEWDSQVWMCSTERAEKSKELFGFTNHNLYLDWNQSASEIFQRYLDSRKYCKGSLVLLAVVKQDKALLRFLLQCSRDQLMREDSGEQKAAPGFRTIDFHHALENGYMEIIAEMVKMAGAELPLKALVKEAGIEEIEKPKYYQGLTVRGFKKKEWAKEGAKGNAPADWVANKTPPLLLSAHRGSIEAVEWFLSDTPFRLYKEFGVNNSHDLQVRTLSRALGGFDQAVKTFLTTRSHLALHCAVLSQRKAEDSIETIKYLINVLPESLEAKSTAGNTPLTLAFAIGRADAVTALIAAGADQTTRDDLGRNIVHLALHGISGDLKDGADKIRSLLGLIDKRILNGLFLERCTEGPGSMTPLARWLWVLQKHEYGLCHNGAEGSILKVLFEFSKGEELMMMDGSGQLPLHQAVKGRYPNLVGLILNWDPALLYRENAMGQTPLELAEALYIRYCITIAPRDINKGYGPISDGASKTIVNENPEAAVWNLCKNRIDELSSAGGKRKLVSVMEASQIAKRLAERKKTDTAQRQELQWRARRRYRRYGGEEEEGEKDEVAKWYPRCK